jgi:hypothetical protein
LQRVFELKMLFVTESDWQIRFLIQVYLEHLLCNYLKSEMKNFTRCTSDIVVFVKKSIDLKLILHDTCSKKKSCLKLIA